MAETDKAEYGKYCDVYDCEVDKQEVSEDNSAVDDGLSEIYQLPVFWYYLWGVF